jgi:hypothetical protein
VEGTTEKETHMSTATQSPVEVIKSVIRKDSDKTLVELAKASTKQTQEPNLMTVQWAIIEVLCERHPHIVEALDEWELDLDGNRSQIEVVIDCMEVK